jgi:hypothetical protein
LENIDGRGNSKLHVKAIPVSGLGTWNASGRQGRIPVTGVARCSHQEAVGA